MDRLPMIRERELQLNYRILCLILMGISFGYSLILWIAKRRSADNPILANVQDVYDQETYQKWRSYQRENQNLSGISTLVTTALYMVLLGSGVLARLATSDNPWVAMLQVLVPMFTLDALVGAAFGYYSTFRIEEKYGFNRSTVGTFVVDQIKEWLVSMAVMAALMSLFILIYENLGDWILVLFTAILIAVLFLVLLLYPWLSKLFNKFTPLEDGELRQRLLALLERNGYTVREIQVMDASRRTTRSNAYFTGAGKTKTIVLYDTIRTTMTDDEIVAVFAHEMGHGLHRDTVKNGALSILQLVVLVLLAWLTVRTEAIYPDFGFAARNYGLALLLVSMAELPLIEPFFSAVMSWVSRRAEYRADAQAVAEGCGGELISGLKKLARENLSNLSPSKLEVVLQWTHTPLSDRIASIERLQKEKKSK